MNQSRTINLTVAAEENYLVPVLKEKFTYDRKLKQRIVLKRHYFEQRRILERTYEDIFQKLNQSILNDIKGFVEKCLDTRGDHLFLGGDSDCIFGATLNLNMQISDHDPTFKLIEKHLKKYKNLHVTRIKANNLKKRNLLDVLEPTKKSKRLFIMIEQAETLTRQVTDVLVGHLKNRIEDDTSPTSVIMLLFCLSTRMQEMSFDHLNCVGRMITITKDRTSEDREILNLLLRSEGLRMKLAYEPMAYIYYHFVNVDASLSSILYLMNHALFEHYHVLENDFVDHDDSSKNPMIPPLGLSEATDRHVHTCIQMSYFFDLLGQRDLYPENILDIYEELSIHDNLACSVKFFNSVRNLSKFSQEALTRRIDKVLKKSQHDCVEENNDKHDVISILSKHRDRILNNEDCDITKKELITDLIQYASQLENPIRNDADRVYYKDRQMLTMSTLTAVRQERTLLSYFCSNQTYFSVLLKQILSAPGQVGIHNLAADIEENFIDIIRLERSCAKKKAPRIKHTPKRRSERISRAPDLYSCSNQQTPKPEDENGIYKAVFVDVIDSMELQQLIKLDSKIKGKNLKRLVWPSLE